MAESKYQIYRTKEKWENVDRHNKEIIEEYRLELKARNKTNQTINQYINDLKIFACYVYDEVDNVPFYKLSKKDIRNFVIRQKDLKLSTARINRLLCSIRTLFEFATEDDDYEEFYTKNVASKIKGLDGEKRRDIVFLTMEEIQYIYDRLKAKRKYQDALLLALLVDTASRKNEIYQIEKSSITQDGSFTNIVIGKGQKKRFRLIYNDMTREIFPLYMKQRGKDDFPYLWYKKVNGKVEALTSDALYKRVKDWNNILEEKTGEYKDFNIHSFRHSALELLSTGEHYICKKNGGVKYDLNVLQALAKHNDISTTNAYLKDKTDDILAEAFKLSGGNNE